MISTENGNTPEKYVHIKYENVYVLFLNKLKTWKCYKIRGITLIRIGKV